MTLTIRDSLEKDLSSIFQIEKRSYPPELQAPHNIIRSRFETFGIKIAEIDGEIVGFYTCVPINLDWNDENLLGTIKQNRDPHYIPWFELYKNSNEFNTLYVTSTAVSSSHQSRGIGKSLVKHSLGLVKELDLEYRASVLRIPGFNEHNQKGINIIDYLERIRSKDIINPMLNLYLSLGFTLVGPISEYEPDRTSMNFGVFAFKK